MSDDLRRRLDEAGRRPVQSPDPDFADALEDRLRAVAASLPPVPPPSPRRGRPVGRWVAAAGVAAVVVAVAALSLGLLRPDPTPGLRLALAGPVNVEVALADGTVLEDPDGLLLPEGAVVTVGEGGSARIGDTVLGPGDVVTVEADRLEVRRRSPAAVVPDPTPTRSPRPTETRAPATTSAPSARPSIATPSPAPQGTASPVPTAEPTPQPTGTAPPARTAPPATAQPTPTPTPAIVRPRLRARLLDGPRIAVRWTETSGAASYVLVATASRSGPAPDPVYPGSRVIGEFAAPPDRAIRLRVRDGVVEMRFMVVALRENGRVLRRSRIVTVAIPVAGDTMGSSPDPSATPTPAPTPVLELTPTPTPTPTPTSSYAP